MKPRSRSSLKTQTVLQRVWAERRIKSGWIETTFLKYGGCDDGSGEASFEAEASDKGRRAGSGCRRTDSWARGRRISFRSAGRGRAAKTELCAKPRDHAR